ncbi:MAG: thioredoxin fold domain-containing protein [Pseudomonadota bacterium]
MFVRALLITLALALAGCGGAIADTATVSDTELDAVRAEVAEKFPRIRPENIKRSAVPGMIEIQQGPLLAYMTADGRYLLQGEIIDLKENQNLTENSRAAGRVEVLRGIGANDGILFEPEETLATVTVFTDIDCTFCRKLHRQMADYHEAGIAVRYLLYPRSGPNTPSWSKAEEVWCAADRTAALTAAKNGEAVAAEACDASMIGQHFETGLNVGLNGTPAILLEDGTLFSGYVPPADLARQLGLEVAPAPASAN